MLLQGGFPRWIHWLVTFLVAVFSTLEWLLRRRVAIAAGLVLAAAAAAIAGVTTIPPSSRTSNICAALNADQGCTWEEVAHLKGTVTLIAFDPVAPGDPWNPVLVHARIRGRDVSMPIGPASEQHVRDVVDDPTTDYRNLMIGSAAWPALRELARLPWGYGNAVPILIDGKALKPKTVSSEATTDAMAETRALRVRIALVTLR